MKLAIITSRYPSVNKPYNHMFVHVRALYFQQQGVDVTIYVPDKLPQQYNYEGIKVVLDRTTEIVKQIDQYDVYYIHLLNFFPILSNGGLAIYKFLKRIKKPLAIGLHGNDVFKYPDYLFDFSFTPKGVARYFYKNYWNFPHLKSFIQEINKWEKSAVFFPSVWMKEFTEIYYKLKLTNPQVVANGIDTEMFSFENLYKNKYKLLTIRPFEKKYGVDIAIEVMGYLPQNFTLDIYGKGGERDYYKSLIKKYKLEGRVKILERFIDRNEMNNLFHNYGMFLALTLFDSQGVTMCEAMSSGLLTISNPISAIPEFVHDNETGILGSTPQEIAKKIITISENEANFERITTNARKSMEAINWKIVGEKELNVLKSLL